MSSSDAEAHEESSTENSESSDHDKSDKESREASDTSKKKSTLRSSINSPGTSRYGRAIKPKSPKNMPIVSSPKNSKIPKIRRAQASIENANGILDNSFKDSKKPEQEEPPMAPSVEQTNIPITEEASVPKVDRETIDCKWKVGQLGWARVGTFPFWPCVVTLDPATFSYHKIKSTGRAQTIMIHVQYFGDKGRHSWVSSNSMIAFTGFDDFQKLAESVTQTIKKKHPKYAAAFLVKPGIKQKWERAVSEAAEVLPMTDLERSEVFQPTVQESKSKSPRVMKLNYKPKKRRLSIDSNEPLSKRNKQDSSNEGDQEEISEKSKMKRQKREDEANNEKNDISINAETPPTPPSSHKDSSDEAAPVPKPKTKRRKKEPDGDFETYFERNRDMVEDEQPDATEAEIRRYLKKTWDALNPLLRKKYQSSMKPRSSTPTDTLTENETDSQEVVTPRENKRLKSKSEKVSLVTSKAEKLSSMTSKAEKISLVVSKAEKLSAMGNKVDKNESEETSGTETVKKTRPYNLFKGTKLERVCQICEKTGKLTRCRGPCYSYFHLSCVKPGESSPEHSMDGSIAEDDVLNGKVETKENHVEDDDNDSNDKGDGKSDEQSEEETFKCIDCLSGVAPACFICNERETDRMRCSVFACGKHYHPACLKAWPQAHWQGGRLSCPYHVCHTCSSDNPQDSHSRSTTEKLARCVRCPSSYHTSTSCIPAGSVILTGSQVICPKHLKSPQPPLNAAWCFLCTRGGSLICCDTCPTSFHPECLGIDAPDGAFICEDCETGRLPLYGEVVWVKLGNYRWWPSRICYPYEVPQNVAAIAHSPGEFCVMFLGTNNYYWVHRGRAFLYQDGDASTKVTAGKRNVDEAYRKALEEANEVHQRLKTERAAAKEYGPRLKPPPYVKLKVNKPVGNVKPTEVESMVACDCDAEWDNPCAPDTDCLNRILSVECNPAICPAGSKCKNQDFVRRQYPGMEPFHTAGRGWGLRSLEFINAGQFVIEYVGEVIDEAEYKRRLNHKKELKNENFYFLTIDNYRMIDAEPKGNLSRFMNHSCQPNCETQKWTVNGDTRIGLFALRDIDPGEELTFNYNLACDGETRKPCLCGAPNCSGFIGLKVQKQQLTTIQQKKIENAEKVKRQRRWRKILCWFCGGSFTNTEDILKCDQKTCNKRYHKVCVNIEDFDSRFSCPWHHCAECGRRTSAHCSFCSTAFCQAHLDGNLMEYGDKGGFTCKLHEGTVSTKSPLEDEKEDSGNDTETEKECSSRGSSSPILTNSPVHREPSPRVSIVEVQLSSEEGEESQKEDDEEESGSTSKGAPEVGPGVSRKRVSNRISLRTQREEERIRTLNALTSSQLEAIIGGSLVEVNQTT
ncbi:histone-lysine N-methyltransferase NSD2 isoform X2 [Cephus cinctus]|uniref:Histone-lysine N-methyltransferase NSD2 isoform X2 n=1 Tax=Cephus cinctus TaxID=211228 RepID=A0AAJ7W5P1_CEPCN|nr:histone-lysine N-methyltransferase NSD2 isoform X2 [Cephus cinctus]